MSESYFRYIIYKFEIRKKICTYLSGLVRVTTPLTG